MLMTKTWRRLPAAVLLPLVLAACTSIPAQAGHGTGTAGQAVRTSPAVPGRLITIRHVWVVELENQGYAQSFATPPAGPYLARTLPRMGALLENYYAIGHSSAANYIAQVSGQAPNLASQSDCPVWAPFPGHAVAGPYHQVLGAGRVYLVAVQTLGGQLSTAGRSWAAYLQDMGNDPARDHTVNQYAARHDGFTFFQPVTANRAFCDAHILSLRPLPGDLARARTTPAFF